MIAKISDWLAVAEHRARIYAVIVAAGPLITGALLISPETWNAWLNLANALLLIGGGSLALKNLSPDDGS